MSEARRRLGAAGENIACKFLEKQGFKIIARNVRTRFGEMDVVAWKKGVIHFVEVKTRSRFMAEFPTIAKLDLYKKRRLLNLARWFLAQSSLELDAPQQFDWLIVSLARPDRPVLYQNILSQDLSSL